MRKYFCCFPILILLASCDKDEIKRGQGEGWTTFDNMMWDFVDVKYFETGLDTIIVSLDYLNDTDGIINNIVVYNVPIISDSIPIIFKPPFNGELRETTAVYFVNPSDDTLGEHYAIDSNQVSYIILDKVLSKNIEGRFRLHFVLADDSLLPKHAPYIPDSFSIIDGSFRAVRE